MLILHNVLRTYGGKPGFVCNGRPATPEPTAGTPPAAFLDSIRGLKTCKPLFESGDGGPQIIPARRQRSSEDRIRMLRGVKHLSPLLLRGNVVVKKLGALIAIADQCCDP
jgi:hypothetical protein